MFVVLLCCPLTDRPLQPLCTIAPLKAFFLWQKKKKKKKDRKSEDNKQKEKGKNTHTHKHVRSPFSEAHTNGHDSRSLFSLCRSPLRRSSAFLSLGLIRLLVEMEAIGEDGRADDESVCAVIALIKRAVLFGGKEKKRKSLTMKRPGALLCAHGLISVKRTPFVWSEAFVN